MKRILSTTLLITGLAFGLAAQAQTKIGVVDLKKVFDGYWRTKQADAQLKERAADFEKARNGLIEDYKKANDDFRKANEGANDPALSADERDKRRKELEKKLQDVREQENSIRTFDQNTRQALADQQGRMRESVLRDIRGVLDEKAKAAAFNLVLDLAATSINQTTVVMYSTLGGTDADLTDAVLKQLNANAPPDGAKINVEEIKDPAKSDDKKGK